MSKKYASPEKISKDTESISGGQIIRSIDDQKNLVYTVKYKDLAGDFHSQKFNSFTKAKKFSDGYCEITNQSKFN